MVYDRADWESTLYVYPKDKCNKLLGTQTYGTKWASERHKLLPMTSDTTRWHFTDPYSRKCASESDHKPSEPSPVRAVSLPLSDVIVRGQESVEAEEEDTSNTEFYVHMVFDFIVRIVVPLRGHMTEPIRLWLSRQREFNMTRVTEFSALPLICRIKLTHQQKARFVISFILAIEWDTC